MAARKSTTTTTTRVVILTKTGQGTKNEHPSFSNLSIFSPSAEWRRFRGANRNDAFENYIRKGEKDVILPRRSSVCFAVGYVLLFFSISFQHTADDGLTMPYYPYELSKWRDPIGK